MNTSLANLSINSLSNAVKECKGMNTYKDSEFVCRCLPGFPFGDPVSKEGCYRCDTECHSHGYCAYPGVCKCFRGLVGDGVTSCVVPIPQVTGVYPNLVRAAGYVEARITFFMDEPFTPKMFYCKFGDVPVSGQFLQSGVGRCTVPPSKEYAVRVAISFDGENYSDSDVFLRYEQREKEEIVINWVPIVATIVVFIWGNLKVSHWSKNPTGDKNLEEEQKRQQPHTIYAFEQNKNKGNNTIDPNDDDNIL